jgi:hypothetical protein
LSNSAKSPPSSSSKKLIKAGDVIRVTAHFINPPKPKILICVCPETDRYMVVNSDPYALAPPASQLRVTSKDVPGLDYPSYVDTTKLVKLSKLETENVVAASPKCHKGTITDTLKKSIEKTVLDHGIMPNDQVKVLSENF